MNDKSRVLSVRGLEFGIAALIATFSWFAQINWSSRNATKAIGFQSIDKQASLWAVARHMGAQAITRKIQAILGCITLYVAFSVFVEPLE